VAAYITAAYRFTVSTSFANPAVTLARAATDTFAGIRLLDTPAFIAARLLDARPATGLPTSGEEHRRPKPRHELRILGSGFSRPGRPGSGPR
jgi:hypothetical protein